MSDNEHKPEDQESAEQAVDDAVTEAEPVEAAEAAEAAEVDAEAAPPADDEPAAEPPDVSAELAEARDQVLRAQAEVQNTRRRAEQDVERARKYALERFAGDLLPVVDNLERALESASGDGDVVRKIAEGVELTLKSFQSALAKYNIEALDPEGEPFDPQLHQAMSSVPNDEVEPNTVVAVMQKGYTLNGRLVRPAMVMVSKASGS